MVRWPPWEKADKIKTHHYPPLVCSPVGHSVPERPNDFYIPAEYH